MTEALPAPATVVSLEGVVARRGEECLVIITDPWCCEEAFHDVLRVAGVWGRTDYVTIYDHETGREVFVFAQGA